MIALLVALLFDTSLYRGDHWTTERTVRLIQEPDHVDQQNVDKIEYSVVESGPERTVVLVKLVPGNDSSSTPSSTSLAFKPSGVLLGAEQFGDPNLERINRMQWTALEAREGLSWSRKWPALGGILDAYVNVRPTTRTKEDTTFAVTYKESDKVKCVATIKVFTIARIVEDLSVTINNVDLPGHVKPGSMVVTEKIKDIHLQPR